MLKYIETNDDEKIKNKDELYELAFNCIQWTDIIHKIIENKEFKVCISGCSEEDDNEDRYFVMLPGYKCLYSHRIEMYDYHNKLRLPTDEEYKYANILMDILGKDNEKIELQSTTNVSV
jgi:hypothetical protein